MHLFPNKKVGHALVGEECQIRLTFMENIDKVNRAIQGASNLEQMMRDVLNEVLSIFNSDRALLLYPCDPDAQSFQVPMEVAKPEYPGTGMLNTDLPLPPDMAQNLREVLESTGPVTYRKESEKPIDKVSAEQFGVQSMMMTALYPKLGKPWAFGLHQCSYPRVWKEEEIELFQEISRCMTDSLSSLLAYRELQENEEKFAVSFHAAPYMILITKISDGTIIDVNEGYTHLSGYTREESIGKTTSELSIWANPEDRENFISTLEKFGELTDFETKFRRKDGTIITVLNSVRRIILNGEKQILSIGYDITNRKKVEEEKEGYIKDLKKINGLMIDRELKMIDLKKEIEELKRKSDSLQLPGSQPGTLS